MPSTFDAPVTATSFVRPDSSARTSSTVSSAVSRSNPTQRSCRARARRRLHPRPDVRVVVEPRDHDLVPGHPLLGERPRHVVRRLRHRPREHHPARVAAEQVRDRLRAAATTSSARRSAAVTSPRLEMPDVIVPATASATCLGTCVPTRPVEVGDALLEGREVLADAVEVEGHAHIIAGEARGKLTPRVHRMGVRECVKRGQLISGQSECWTSFGYAKGASPFEVEIDGYLNFQYLTHSGRGGCQATPARSRHQPDRFNKCRWDGRRRPALLLRSSPWKAGHETNPWEDVYDLDHGHVRYFGDHKPTTVGPVGRDRRQ